MLFLINLTFLVVGGFLYSGGFLGIEGYGYGWDKTRTGLLVLLAALILYIWRHLVQDKIPLHLREQIPQTPEEERGARGAEGGADRGAVGVDQPLACGEGRAGGGGLRPPPPRRA